ncbi:C13 family peptidase [Rhodanobacter sp. L36]|uniref:C13 family peptidase n=1 Tax=Rhodanobacter sp. L36 TaxID=1747221 RepID=UPI00131C8B1D|nr:C13 family peptidase [Rhodanobacter sp. L36]
MRHALTALLAFVAGIIVMLWWPAHHGNQHPASTITTVSAPTIFAKQAPANVATAASTNTDDTESADAGSDWPANGPSPEQALFAQPRMVRDALAKLTPRVAGKPNLYVVSFAGDGEEDVFRNEAEYAAQLTAHRFGPTAHSVVLENNPATLDVAPLASWSNLEATLDGLATVMHPDQDILLLYLTTHGDPDHNLLVDMDPLPLDQIGAQDLAGILEKRPFKWKVVVVNACYSGGFVPPLHHAGTLVLTAARTDRSSFGCGSDSDATYFGKAWLIDALNRTPDFIAAFALAKSDIATWEKQGKLTPSEPQIDIGDGIAAQLAAWRSGFTPGAAVPFKPAAPAQATSMTGETP